MTGESTRVGQASQKIYVLLSDVKLRIIQRILG